MLPPFAAGYAPGVPGFEVSSSADPDHAVLALRGELDLSSAPAVEAAVRRAIQRGARQLVLDLRELAFMDSTGLRTVLRADALARQAGARLALVDGAEPVRRVFEMTGMRQRLTWVDEPQAEMS
jgi:anti-anti-sigma factor